MLLPRIAAGDEPGAEPDPEGGPTVAELAERYLGEHVAVRCKPITVMGYRRVIERHILPRLGKVPIGALDRTHVAELHYRLRKTPVAANDTVGALSRMLNRAEAWGLVPAGSNPCRFVTPYRTRRLERFLTEDEFRHLGEALDELEAGGSVPVHAAAAIRLLMLTGCRCGEVLKLRWEDVALERNEVKLPDSKTGPAGGSAVACGVAGSGGGSARGGQSLGDRGPRARHAADASRLLLVSGEGTRGSRRGAASRPSPLLRLACSGAGRRPHDDRQATRPPEDSDDVPLRPPCTGFCEGVGGAGGGQHRADIMP